MRYGFSILEKGTVVVNNLFLYSLMMFGSTAIDELIFSYATSSLS
jgi:hypothetical protein